MMNAEISAKYAVDFENLREYIRTKMANAQPKRLTYADVAQKTQIPRGTIDNFFDGTTKRPSFDFVCALIWAVDGSVDEAIGLKLITPAAPAAPVPDHAVRDFAQKFVDEMKVTHKLNLETKDQLIIELREENKRLLTNNHRLLKFHRFFVAENVVLALALAVILTVDSLNPHIGWIRSMLQLDHASNLMSLRG